MACLRMGNSIVCVNEQSVVRVGKRLIPFDLHYWGPIPLKKNGDPIHPDHIPRKFWTAVKRNAAYRRWRKKADEQIAKSGTKMMAE
jgi:hypothetical protein